ncbi:tumor necrosis factor receptor superfamily member 1B [Echinops telfairi]|uniref:Tumor necrosis factor receptor superfamily member 1B n=1 Tax=Echinops telfairi TaxID=9371 RepID=A0ABM0IQK6_ECHTE|nr:tumor necrosis factor receptor superfamily member 1B [Echinops telfairi]
MASLSLGLQSECAVLSGEQEEGALLPYVPESDPKTCRPEGEYYENSIKMCCSKCQPGQHVQSFCNATSDTVCAPCEDNTYTELLNFVSECFSCDSRCSAHLVEVQACTREQNRVCGCKPGWYCKMKIGKKCRHCTPLSKCPPGSGVAKPGTETTNVVCSPCAPGTFSSTTSYTDSCRPHRTCSLVAIPGNASMDTVCGAPAPALTGTWRPAPTRQPEPTRSPPVEATPGADTVPRTSPLLPLGPSPPAKGLSTGNITLPIGLIVGATAFGLLLIALVNCVIMTQRKKKSSCLSGQAKAPHLPADKAQLQQDVEQQHLLTTAPSSSSSSLESSASTAGRQNQPRARDTEKPSGPGAARASCTSPEPSPGGGGTHVNVTCIVNVCSSSDHGSQCPSQASSVAGDVDGPQGSPRDEQVPFSTEEQPFQSQLGAPETLPQSSEEKPLPLGVPDVGMKPR